MRVLITILFFITLNIFGYSNKELIKLFDKNAQPHFKKSGCLVDIFKYIKKQKYTPVLYIENTTGGYSLFCNNFWVLKDKTNKKYYILRALVGNFENFKFYQSKVNAKFILNNNYKTDKYKGIKWWIYKKTINKSDYKYILSKLESIKDFKNCEDDISYKGRRNRIGKGMFLQGRIVFGYPNINKIDYTRGAFSNIDSDKNCKKIKELGEFVIYLFDGNKNINQGTTYIDLEFEKYKKAKAKELNRKFNKFLMKNIKKLLLLVKKYKE